MRDAEIVETRVPARLDRLPWGRFHTLVAAALGITWVLDGLEVTIAGAVASALAASPSLRFRESDVGLAASFYLAGAVTGALGFAWLTDRLGRKPMFFLTLGLYLTAAGATALSWNLESFCFFRFLTGAGIGGEYSAVNSTIQEMIPARYRGWTDLAINGSFWIGGAIGAAGALILLDPGRFGPDTGWRIAFLLGALFGPVILLFRRWIPESPRWLAAHGREAEAEKIVDDIESAFLQRGIALEEAASLAPLILRPRRATPLSQVFQTLFITFRVRTFVALSLMAAQAFFYNSIFFTYALVLTNFYGVPAAEAGWHVLPFTLSNVLGALALAPFFDSVGRKPMIAITYGASGVLLAAGGFLFARGLLGLTELTAVWTIVFFFASPAAGAAYLTASENFPVEIRAMAIAFFFSIGTAIGGVAAPFFFGKLIETGSRMSLFGGYLLGAGLMIAAAIIMLVWGVAAERKPLEAVAPPLSSVKK